MISAKIVSGALVVGVLGAFHVFFPSFARRFDRYSDRWVAFSAGIAIGYVFLYLLPKIALYSQNIMTTAPETAGIFNFGNFRLYAIALVGVLVYVIHYRELVKVSDTASWVISISTLMICVYNLLIGYLIASIARPGLGMYLLSALVFSVHSLGVNHQLRGWHLKKFDRYVRWLLAVSVVLGWFIGMTGDLLNEIVAYVTAFLSGAIITNALSEELPTQEGARVAEFFLGAALFCVIAMFIYSLPVVIE